MNHQAPSNQDYTDYHHHLQHPGMGTLPLSSATLPGLTVLSQSNQLSEHQLLYPLDLLQQQQHQQHQHQQQDHQQDHQQHHHHHHQQQQHQLQHQQQQQQLISNLYSGVSNNRFDQTINGPSHQQQALVNSYGKQQDIVPVSSSPSYVDNLAYLLASTNLLKQLPQQHHQQHAPQQLNQHQHQHPQQQQQQQQQQHHSLHQHQQPPQQQQHQDQARQIQLPLEHNHLYESIFKTTANASVAASLKENSQQLDKSQQHQHQLISNLYNNAANTRFDQVINGPTSHQQTLASTYAKQQQDLAPASNSPSYVDNLAYLLASTNLLKQLPQQQQIPPQQPQHPHQQQHHSSMQQHQAPAQPDQSRQMQLQMPEHNHLTESIFKTATNVPAASLEQKLHQIDECQLDDRALISSLQSCSPKQVFQSSKSTKPVSYSAIVAKSAGPTSNNNNIYTNNINDNNSTSSATSNPNVTVKVVQTPVNNNTTVKNQFNLNGNIHNNNNTISKSISPIISQNSLLTSGLQTVTYANNSSYQHMPAMQQHQQSQTNSSLNTTPSHGSATNLLGFMGLYVGNLSPDLTKEQLEKIFSKYGEPVKAHRLIRSPVAFIKYENTESPRAAIEDLHGVLLPEMTLNPDQPLKLHFDRNDAQLRANYRPTELPPKADNGECYGWRTTVCRKGKNCTKKHISINRGIDFQMWMIKSSINPQN